MHIHVSVHDVTVFLWFEYWPADQEVTGSMLNRCCVVCILKHKISAHDHAIHQDFKNQLII